MQNDGQVNEVISGLPRLNYVSTSIDDSIASSVLQIDSLDANYLSNSQLLEYRHLVNDHCSSHGQRVTHKQYKRRDSLNEVNCTWNNLSMATQDFLQRYNFTGHKTKADLGGKVDCRNTSMKSTGSFHCSAPPSTPEPAGGTERILDIERLRNLPKLL